MDANLPGRMRVRIGRRGLMLRFPASRRGIARLSRLTLVATLVVAACGPDVPPEETPPGPDTLVDAEGVQHVFEAPAVRIVSLVPSATETLLAIGADGALVGRTDFDRAEWLEEIPSVGGGLEPNIEVLLSLRPDLVIRFGGEQDPETPRRLDDLGIRHIAVRPTSLENIYATTAIIGRVTGHEVEADALSEAIRAGLDSLVEASTSLPPVTFAYILGGSPPFVAGPSTYIEEVLTLLGGQNVFNDLEAPYATVSPEALRARQIDVVLVGARGQYDESLTPGARIEEIGDALESPGPGVVEAARSVAEAMHGRTLR